MRALIGWKNILYKPTDILSNFDVCFGNEMKRKQAITLQQT